MPADSPIFAHTRDLAVTLLRHVYSAGSFPHDLKSTSREDLRVLQRAVQLAEARTLALLCDETFWSDYGLQAALRGDPIGEELAGVARQVLREDGEDLRMIRARVQREIERLATASLEETELGVDGGFVPETSGDLPRAATARYLAALAAWIAPTQIPDPLRKRVEESWFQRFGAAMRSGFKSDPAAAKAYQTVAAAGEPSQADVSLSPEEQAEDRRFDELQRQSWRMDEILARLEKWLQANPQAARSTSGGSTTGSRWASPGGGERSSLGRLATVGLIVLGVVAVLGAALWVASGSSVAARDLVARVQVGRLGGLPLRIARAAAWLGSEPVPANVFTSEMSILQNADDDSEPISEEQVDGAFLELQQKQVCRADLAGWVFHPAVGGKFRTSDATGEDWWNRSAELVMRSAPADDESQEQQERWRALLPHLIALFESGKGKPAMQMTFQRLLETLSRALLATRIEPGRRPTQVVPQEEADALQKVVGNFVESATAYFEKETKNLEVKYGRFSPEMVTVHRLLAEISWRARKLKEERDSLVRAIRTVEKLEGRDVQQIAFLNFRLAISRAIAGDTDGSEEAFAAELQALRDLHGDLHPELGRAERDIARVYADLAQFKLAEGHYQKALDLDLKSYPVPTPAIAGLHAEQGQFLIDYGRFDQGIESLERGIDVWKKIDYPTSPNLAQAYRSLANAQMLAGKLAEAEKNERTQVDLYRREYGIGAPQVRDAELDLAVVLLDSGDSAKAEEAKSMLSPRIAPALNSPIPDDPETALVRSFYARSLALTGKPGEAVAQFERAIDVLLDTQMRPSLIVADCLRDFGQALVDINRAGEGVQRLADAETELVALNKARPRYTHVASTQIEDIRARLSKSH